MKRGVGGGTNLGEHLGGGWRKTLKIYGVKEETPDPSSTHETTLEGSTETERNPSRVNCSQSTRYKNTIQKRNRLSGGGGENARAPTAASSGEPGKKSKVGEYWTTRFKGL